MQIAAKTWFGHENLRPGQAAIVSAMLAGRDLLAVRSTGSGKSLCFQLPAVMSDGTTVVISPLIALMRDQVQGLRARGIDAAALTSAVGPAEREALLGRLGTSPPRLLYVSPERIAGHRAGTLASRLRVRRVVVDEAHCISEWGHDFRPDYRRILPFLVATGRPPVAALTATATPATRRDIERCLAMRDPVRFSATVNRPNLFWQACRATRSGLDWPAFESTVREALQAGTGPSVVLYLLSRAGTVRAAHALRRGGIRAVAYHAGMEPHTRSRLQDEFSTGRHRVMCATSAFGMGVDIPEIRLVCHLGMPGALEAYVQEAGRAGRDGLPARCLLIELPGDAQLHRSRAGPRVSGDRGAVADREPPPRHVRALASRRLAEMRTYVRTRGCRRAAIARYFGEGPPACTGCDRCGGPR